MVVERRKNKKRKDTEYGESVTSEKPTKEEYAIAKWIRNNVPSKKTKFDRNHIVEYFTGSRAVDALLNQSPWNKTLFESRQQVTNYLEIMLRHKFFHRAKKIIITEDELNKMKNNKKRNKDQYDFKDEKKTTEKDRITEKKETLEINDIKDLKQEDKYSYEKEEQKKEGLRKKPKVRLEMHMEQYFVDSNDAYVWIYEPIPVYYWFFGTLLVLSAIGVCLFPLWPLTVRHAVWYLSVAAAGFLVFILSLIILRSIIFCVLWILTLGRHHLWLFPNLIEDVGFFASFWPLYQYEYIGSLEKVDKSYKKKKSKKLENNSEEIQPSSKERSESSSETSKTGSPLPKKAIYRQITKVKNESEASEEGSESDKSNTEDFEIL